MPPDHPVTSATDQDESPPTRQHVEQTTCCIVGGGPAGAMLALLLARQGVPVVLLEAHLDFERDFRGDTLHPAVMENLDELGLAERLLEIRHTKVRTVAVQTPGGPLRLPLGQGYAHWKTRFPYITVMAQSRFLAFITQEAERYPTFRLLMGARVEVLVEADGVVRGVRYRGQDGWGEVRAALTVGADGRFSRLRALAGFEPIKTSPPIDVLWFRLSRREDDSLESLDSRFGSGLFLIFIDRFDYWQVGVIIAKGSYQQMRAAGLTQLRQVLASAAPEIADRVEELQAWQQIAVLSVESSRLKRWYKPGLLLIGDAAHVMSPVGGVGINYAIQDAVVASNVLGAKLQAGAPLQARDLAEVQRQREWPTRVMQGFQTLAQRAVVRGVSKAQDQGFTPPRLVRQALQVPGMLVLPARFIGYGLCPPHVTTGKP
jgi:2-polyprenyl-6-methoxyphenol hydroxylase-like FAD-dependent oxidoreductase